VLSRYRERGHRSDRALSFHGSDPTEVARDAGARTAVLQYLGSARLSHFEGDADATQDAIMALYVIIELTEGRTQTNESNPVSENKKRKASLGMTTTIT
jgi:hypothetical protein